MAVPDGVVSLADVRSRKPDEIARLERAAAIYDELGRPEAPITVFQALFRFCKKHDVDSIGMHPLLEGPPMRIRAPKRPPENLF